MDNDVDSRRAFLYSRRCVKKQSGNLLHCRSFLRDLVLQVIFQCDRVVVFRVMRTVHKSNPTTSGGFEQGADKIGISIKLPKVTSPEFMPFLWIVAKPLAQLTARRDLLEPAIHVQRRFFTPRGHSRSTRKRTPSLGAAVSSTRFSVIISIVLDFDISLLMIPFIRV